MTETRSSMKWFWAWEASKEEQWLERMAREGWHLVSGGILFKFRKGAPAEHRYRLDYRTEKTADLREYVTLCEDAGWEHVCRFGGWHYFRTADPAAPELHSDPRSLADRYRKLLGFLVILMVINVAVLHPYTRGSGEALAGIRGAVEAIRAATVALLAYGAIRVGLLIRRLEGAAERRPR
jgi:hypothetical protein